MSHHNHENKNRRLTTETATKTRALLSRTGLIRVELNQTTLHNSPFTTHPRKPKLLRLDTFESAPRWRQTPTSLANISSRVYDHPHALRAGENFPTLDALEARCTNPIFIQ